MNCLFKDDRGFSIVEMVIVMAVFVIIIMVTSEAFNTIVTKSRLQTQLADTNISGIIGLEMLRVDVESAGYGLPWKFKFIPENRYTDDISYAEAIDDPGVALNRNAQTYSDSGQNKVPPAVSGTNNIASADPTVVLAGTDVLAVRSLRISNDAAGKRWTYVESGVAPRQWNSDMVAGSDNIIMTQLIDGSKAVNDLLIKRPAGSGPGVASTPVWTSTFSNYSTVFGKPTVYTSAEKKSDMYTIYGVTSSTALRMPFNRADYYVRRPAVAEDAFMLLPQRCNPASGVLFKAIVGHTSGRYDEMPIMECVLDFQVVYGLKTPGSSVVADTSDISALNPAEIRERIKEIRMYILTHDGGKDNNFNYTNATIGVGPGDGLTSGTGRTLDFAAQGVPDWQNYRWRVYQVVARPMNLVGNIAQ
jgi:prepilin-type N-terminal cleavage/methylation domain-containing protein